MSDKPRPRPRPRPRLATNSQNGTTGGAGPSSLSSSAQTGSAISLDNADDENALFFRNRGWDANVIKARAARAKKADDDSSPNQNESDDDFGFHSPNSKKRTKAGKLKPPPAWTTQVERGGSALADRRSSTVACSDEERHHVLSDSDDSVTGPRNINGKRPKARAKSRSPTPPPALPEHFRNEARRIARQVVREQNPLPIIDLDGAEARRAYQPVLNIESSEEDDPDFAAIAAKVRAEYKRKASTLSSTQMNAAGPSTSRSGVKVKILVKWVPHPFDEFAQEQPEEVWNHFIDRDSNLREIFTTTAKLKHLIASQLVVTHDGHQIYQTSTPRSLEGLAGEIHLSACDDNTYSHLQDMRKKGSTFTGNDPRLEFAGVGGSNAPAAEDSGGEGDKPANDEPKKIKIGLRSARFPQTKYLNVRAEMTCRAILQHYLKVMNIEGKHDQGRLSFDGEHLAPDSQIGDADIDLDDDEVLVDVVGL